MHRTLSSTSALAVSAMIDLAVQSRAAPVSLTLIGQRQKISKAYLDQLFARLRRHGLVRSTRGPGGGYSLGRDAEQISVADIVVAVARAGTGRGRKAQGRLECVGYGLAHDLWASLNAKLTEWLAAISLQAMVDERLARGATIEVVATPLSRAISPRPMPRAIDLTVPNSVFALGSTPSTRARELSR